MAQPAPAPERDEPIPEHVVALLRCPATGQPLRIVRSDGVVELVTPDGAHRYPILDGIPVLVPRQPAG